MRADSFVRRAAIAVGLVLLAVATYLLVWHALHFLLLLFAGILLAVFLNGLGGALASRTGLPYGIALATVCLVLLAALVGLGWLVGPRLGQETESLLEQLPAAVADVRGFMAQRPLGRVVLERVPATMEGAGTTPADVLGRVTGLFSTTMGSLLSAAIVLFLGIYMASSPHPYRSAMVHLVPARGRKRAAEVLDALALALRRWLAGRFASMAVVAALTAVGLMILGLPLVLGLSLLAGLLSFVPFLGPIASGVPAVLVGWGTGGPMLALWVAVTYAAVQLVESYLITPLIQRWAVSMLPAALISAQVLMGLAAGALGVLLATPLAVVAVVLVQTLYIEGTLGEEVQVLGT